MAQVVNVRRDVDDKFYRYKCVLFSVANPRCTAGKLTQPFRMPVLLTKIEGKGNGIKTVIPNMSDVARSLQRPPAYPTKFFGCELGAQTSFDEKADRYIVNGAHDASRLRELLDTFIDKFVLCGSCKNPETNLIINKGDFIIRDCQACGQRTNVDMRHKLTVFILKNPPKVKKTKKGKDGVDAENGGASPLGDDAGLDDADSDDELTKRIKAEAAGLGPSPTADMTEDDWAVDTSAEAVKARVKALEGQLANASLGNGDDDSDDDVNSPYSQLGSWAEENRSTVSVIDVYKRVQELGIEKKHKTLQVLVQALFTENIVAEIPKYAPMFAKVRSIAILSQLICNMLLLDVDL